MNKHPKGAGTFKEPPLQTQQFIRKDPKTGLDVAVTSYQRGILSFERRHYTAENIMAMLQSNPKKNLDNLRDHLRNTLENLGKKWNGPPRCAQIRVRAGRKCHLLPDKRVTYPVTHLSPKPT